ncbi:amino acid permease [Clostridium tertium]|jgi:amino acid transporter|uniref:amino acid permease n=1 Tax=Clostridium TaxID=1485 RepID=UPI0018A9A2D1|nr:MULTISPECIES: amino acid permease [Clostridium]MDB1922302.1 amino acid permease [Clostridium tertium]MDB1926910.1 amino acid permease [Clostridium tertium]MDB1929847.1 amino acid permease [Clostridium tertium]MDB1931663.1 amino acid permease [Clostridium tertium]MDB1938291.1 amino acid permease [Clostridium tertium]
MGEDAKKIRWYNLALMAFVSVWGFGNVVNNFANQGLTVVVSWILIIALYFVPYALMVGELGSTFKDGKGGVSTWIRQTMGPTLAYFAGWTYWVVHVPYLAQKPQAVLIALGWAVKQDGTFISNMNTLLAQSLTLVVFLVFLWVASRGITSLKKIGTIAGTSVFVMSMLYILLMVAAPAIRGIEIATTNITLKSIIPNFDFTYFTTLSMLVFAVGGAEKISPYVNNMNKPSKEFPRGMIVLAAMVAISALLGSMAMGMMFDANNIPKDLMMNGQYYAFKMLGEYYGLGNLFLIIYAIANMLAQISALVFSIDAPLKVLIGDADKNYIPRKLTKTNKYGAPINGYAMTAILVGILIMVPALGIGDMNALFDWLLKLNSVVMPLRYLWVFLAFIMLKKLSDKFNSEYKFVKNNKVALGFGIWCFIFTAFACLMGMFPKGVETYSGEWWFQISLTIITIVVLLGLGAILPKIAKKDKTISK